MIKMNLETVSSNYEETITSVIPEKGKASFSHTAQKDANKVTYSISLNDLNRATR